MNRVLDIDNFLIIDDRIGGDQDRLAIWRKKTSFNLGNQMTTGNFEIIKMLPTKGV